jgi:hypothetical protein
MNRAFGGILILTAIIACLVGCTAPRPPLVVTDPDPSIKIPAIKIAVAQKDRDAAKQLVKDLDSDDPAVRFYAIEGLRKLTGEHFGYRYYDDADVRKPAVERWRAWLNGTQVQDSEQASPAPAIQEPSTQP